jgi:hypothetical protein
MFISFEKKCLYRLYILLIEISYSKLAPQLSHGGGSTPTETAISPYRDDGVGLQLRGHICGPDRIAHVRSELGFDVKVECFPSKSS